MSVFNRYKIKIASALSMLFFLIFLQSAPPKILPIVNHIYEIFHQYKGPMDYAIDYIKSNYKNTKALTVATNYEEYSYVYYLGCKAAVGYVGNNLEEDLKLSPDIIIVRKRNAWVNPRCFDKFLQKSSYRKISFPVYDYPVNNLPELSYPYIPHLFKTKLADNEAARLEMYVKQDSRLLGNAKY